MVDRSARSRAPRAQAAALAAPAERAPAEAPPPRDGTPQESTAPASAVEAEAPRAPWAPAGNDRVLFLALNRSGDHASSREAAALLERGADVTVIDASFTAPFTSCPNPDGTPRLVALGSASGARAFAESLGLPPPTTEKVAAAIVGAQQGRAELAKIAVQWAAAERGEACPSRLVLSGHTDGELLWGEGPLHASTGFSFEELGALAAALPKGAASVEDLLVSACSTGYEDQIEFYAKTFPNLAAVVAYDGTSPSSKNGAIAHVVQWESLTRGQGTPRLADYAPLPRTENLVVWTRAHGYESHHPRRPLAQLRTELAQTDAAFAKAWSGERSVGNVHSGPVRQRYVALQLLSRRADVPSEERAALRLQRQQVLRLLYYARVAERFAAEHAQDLKAGYEAVGLVPPDFAKLGRRQALSAARDLDEAASRSTPTPAATVQAATLVRGLAELSPALLPALWIGSDP